MLIIRASIDESGKVPDEQVVKLAFVVRDHQQVDVKFPIAVHRSVEGKETKTLTLMDGFQFSNLGVLENMRGNCKPSMTSSLKNVCSGTVWRRAYLLYKNAAGHTTGRNNHHPYSENLKHPFCEGTWAFLCMIRLRQSI